MTRSGTDRPEELPAQEQPLPGSQSKMDPQPVDEDPRYRGSGKLQGKVALITGGDSGIGRAVAIAFSKEGADVAILYDKAVEDAAATRRRVEELGRRCFEVRGDLREPAFAREAVQRVRDELGGLDILVNNAATQQVEQGIEAIEDEQLRDVFDVNFESHFRLIKAALPHLKEGSTIINTTSVQAYEPKPHLIHYACTKSALLTLTRALARELAERGIRVNAVAPGPVWTPLIVATFPADEVKSFGKQTPMKRAGQPAEIAPAFVFLASEVDSSFMTGQVLHPNGGSAMVS